MEEVVFINKVAKDLESTNPSSNPERQAEIDLRMAEAAERRALRHHLQSASFVSSLVWRREVEEATCDTVK